MSTSRPFTYNPGSLIPGTEKFGNLTVGIPTVGFESTGLQWWNGPDEDLGYVIAKTRVDINGDPLQPTPIPGQLGNVAFNRTKTWMYSEFVGLTNLITGQNLTTPLDCKTYLESNDKWTSWEDNIEYNFFNRVLVDDGTIENENCLTGTINDITDELADTASLIVTPNGYKEGVLYNVLPQDGTNILLQSQNFNTSPWIKLGSPNVTVVENTSIAPDGTTTASLITSNDNGQFGIRQTVVIEPNTIYRLSFWARSTNNAVIRADVSDLNNTTINLTSTWTRYIVNGSYNLPYGYGLQFVDIVFSGNQLSKTFELWGAQLEVGTVATDYQRNTTTRGGFQVTRATNGTRVNSEGLIEMVSYNLISYSEDFDNGYWVKSDGSGTKITITANQTTAPDGSFSADLMIPTTLNIEHNITPILSSIYNIQYGAIGDFCCSIYVKPAGYNFFFIRSNINGVWSATVFNILNGTVVSMSPNFTGNNIKNVGNGWYLLSVTFTNQTNSGIQFTSTPTGAVGFTGDGVSGAYIWGAQLTMGNELRPYQKTTNRFNIPVLDYTNSNCPSILTEPQATNFMLNTTTLTNTWLFSGAHQITNDLFILGSGKNLKNLINDSINSNANSLCIRTDGLTNIIKSGSNSLSFFIKKTSTHNSISVWGFVLSGGTGTGSYNINFNVDTLSVSYPQTSTRFTNRVGGVIPIGNNIYYCYERFTSDANYSIPLGFSPTTSGSNQMLIGQEMSIGGFQMEQTTYPTSYIPTGASSVTRNGTTITKTGIEDLIGQTEGTILIKGIQTARGVIFRLRGTTTANSVSVFSTGSNGRCEYAITKNGATISTASTSAPNNQFNKNIIIRYTQTNMQVYLNGVLFFNYNYPAPTDFTSILDRIEFGSLTEVGLARFNLIAIWKTPLTGQQAINLTTL